MNKYKELRIFSVNALNHYVQKRYNELSWISKFGLDHIKFKGDFIMIHSWKPGYVKLSAEQANLIKQGIAGERDDIEACIALPTEWFEETDETGRLEGVLSKVLAPGLFELLSLENCESKKLTQGLIQLRGILEEVGDRLPIFPAIQNEYELRSFLEMVQMCKPKVVVEIGTAGGGVLYGVSQMSDQKALLVSIDYAGGPYGGGQDNYEVDLYSCFGYPQQQFEFIRDRSFHHSTKQDLKRILGDRKIDLLFIDGDHSYGGVSSDYNMYSELVAEDGKIVFHDINLRPETWGRGYDVRLFWDEVKKTTGTYEEIIDPDGGKYPAEIKKDQSFFAYGIGVISL